MRAFSLAVFLLFISLSINAFGATFVTDGLISFWTFDKADIKGDILKDVMGKNDATIVGEPAIVQGKINEALSFDGLKSLVEVPINDDLSRIGTDAMTIEAWVSVEKPCHGVICGRDYWILHWTSCGAPPVGMIFYVGVGGWKSVTGKTTVKEDWHHWAGVYDGKELKIYADGKKDGSIALSGEIAGTGDGHANFIVFGKDYHTTVNNDRWNKVMIDEVRIYNKALTDDEIMQNFNTVSNKLSIEPLDKLAGTWGMLKTEK